MVCRVGTVGAVRPVWCCATARLLVGLVGLIRLEMLRCPERLVPVPGFRATAANRPIVWGPARPHFPRWLSAQVGGPVRHGAAARSTGRVGGVEVTGSCLASATLAPRTLARRFPGLVLVFERPAILGAGSSATSGSATATSRAAGFRRRSGSAHPRCVGGGILVVMVV